MTDYVYDFKKVWRFQGKIFIMFVDDYGRYRTFREFDGNFYEITYNNILSNYRLNVCQVHAELIQRAVLRFKASKHIGRYGL